METTRHSGQSLSFARERSPGPDRWSRRMETVAMYWEPRIKTYGFHVVKELSIFKCLIPINISNHWERALELIENIPNRFHLICGQLNETSELNLSLLCESDQGRSFSRDIEAEFPVDEGFRYQMITPVELLYFQGPHFGDRFGIADFTYRALKSHTDGLLAAVFSCASIYLVLAEGAADRAKEGLTAAFKIPD